MLVRMSLLSLAVLTLGFFVDAGSAADKEKPLSDKQRRAEIDKLIKQLSAEDFKSREKALRQLMKRDDAWPALRVAAKSDDAEVRRRAQTALEVIDKRLGKRAIERAIAKLKKGQTDQFVDQVVTWRQYMDEDGWKAALEHAQAIADKAGKLNGCKYKARPRIDVAKLKFSHADQLTIPNTLGTFQRQRVVAEGMKIPDNSVGDAFLISRGPVELDKQSVLAWSVVFLNGDLKVGDPTHYGNIDQTFVVCDGSVTVTGAIYDSVVLATGNVSVGISVENSVVISGGEVKAGVDLVPGVNNNGVAVEKSSIQRHQRNPLKL